MPLLVVSPTLPDAPENGIDFRTTTLLRDLRAHGLDPYLYQSVQPAMKWRSKPAPGLTKANLDNEWHKPWMNLYTYRAGYYCDVLFDLRRYRNLIPDSAMRFYRYAASASDFCLALAEEDDHDLLSRICRKEGTGLYTSVAGIVAAKRFAVA